MQRIKQNTKDIVLNETKLQNTKINKYLWRRSGTKIPKSTNICAAVQREFCFRKTRLHTKFDNIGNQKPLYCL